MQVATSRPPETIELDGAFNARIVAWYDDGHPRLIRSSALDHLTQNGIHELARLGVTTIIDLREPGEESPRQFPGIRTVSVPLYHLSEGAPKTGELASIYRFMLVQRGNELAEAVGTIADNTNGATLVHCSMGKDRTGLVVALALLCMGVPRNSVVDDYATTERSLSSSMRNDILMQIALDAPEEPLRSQTVSMRLTSPASMMSAICCGLESVGGASAYLCSHGLDDVKLGRLKNTARKMRRLSILHCSDIHAGAGEGVKPDVDGLEALDRVASYAHALDLRPDVLVCTGDLIHKDADLYPRVVEGLHGLAQSLDVPLVVVPGNHDDFDEARHLTNGALPSLPYRLRVAGYDFLMLDSSEGDVPESQLVWLRRQLRNPDAQPAVLVLHHSPVPSIMPSLAKVALHNGDKLGEAMDSGVVRLVLAGHYHHAMCGVFRGVPVCVAPSLAYEQEMSVGPEWISCVPGASFFVEELYEDGELRTTMVPMPPQEPVLFTVRAGSSTHRERRVESK